MSGRELVVLGTASQAPTRHRNHNGYFLRWDGEGILFDPGEGTQRQMILAGVSSPSIGRICVTHFHGDHCLGLPGVIQRMSLDGVSGPVDVHFPAGGEVYYERLRRAAIFDDRTELRPRPAEGEHWVTELRDLRLVARRLDHRADTVGWRLEEPDGVRMVPERLRAAGIFGPDVGRLQREGSLMIEGRRISLEEMSAPRRGQRMAFIMDTRVCDAAFELAADADLVVCEATFLSSDADLAQAYGHLTAGQAASIAAVAGARRLVLTHFSQRYGDDSAHLREATEVFGDVVAARDLDVVTVPPRR
ncbi:MAG TPA: ribonuclease Z [Acidimicrobiales bacterium]|nr:ribonuclease Z [Acidimicrobiales bacterium]